MTWALARTQSSLGTSLHLPLGGTFSFSLSLSLFFFSVSPSDIRTKALTSISLFSCSSYRSRVPLPLRISGCEKAAIPDVRVDHRLSAIVLYLFSLAVEVLTSLVLLFFSLISPLG